MSEPSVEDRVLIRELYDRFYSALNGGDAEGVKACCAPGGTITRYKGDTITPEFSAGVGVEWQSDPVGVTYQHHVTNVIVDPDEDGREDRRAVRMYFMVTGVEDPPNIKVRWSCRAHDVVQLVDGRRLFLRRRISLNHNGTA